MKILVIGGTGRLGSCFCKYFAKNNFSYVSPSRDELDITKIDSIRKYFSVSPQFTHVLFCAAYTAVDLAEKESEKCFLVNELGVKNILSFIEKIPFIHFSTDFVFDGQKKTGYMSNDERAPLNVYGKSKLAAEKILEIFGKNWVNIRISSLITEKSSFLSFLQKNITQKIPTYLWSNNLMTPTFVEPLVEKVVQNFILKNYLSGHFHLTESNTLSWYELANDLFPKSKKLFIPVENFKSIAPRPKYSVLLPSV